MLMLKEMEYVYAVYQERSFSRAAQKLYLSQPALSAAVRKAEAEIQTPIFDRSTNPIRLTAAGEYYINSVRRIMDIREEMEGYFQALAGECQGTVQVGAASFFCAHVLPGVIEEFQRQYPAYRVSLLEANARDLRTCLQSGVIDLSLDVSREESRQFQSRVWREEVILLAVPAAFPVNRGLEGFQLTAGQVAAGAHLSPGFPAVDLAAFAQTPFLLLKKDNDLHQRAMGMCRRAGFQPRAVMELDQLLTSYYVARDGKGAAFLRDGIVQLDEQDGRLCFYKLGDPEARREVFLSWRRAAPLSRQAEAFLAFLTGEDGGSGPGADPGANLGDSLG